MTAVLVIAGSIGVLVPSQAVAAPWTTSTQTTSSFSALTLPLASTLTCSPNGDGTVAIGFAYGGPTEPTTTYSVMNGTTVLGSGASSPVRVAGSALLSLGQVYTVTVRVNYLQSWVSTSTATTKIQTALVTTNLSCA